MAILLDDRLRFAMAIAMPAGKRPPPRRECARQGPSSHPPAKPRGRDHARHRRPGPPVQCRPGPPVQCPPRPRRHHRGRAGRAWPRAPIWARAWGPLQRRGRQGTGQLRAADSLFDAGIHREDIDQASDFQDMADLLLRGGKGQVTPVFPGPSQHLHQYPKPQESMNVSSARSTMTDGP